MDKIVVPDKINFHKQASKVLYSNLLKYFLNKSKLESKLTKLEEKIKRERVASKGWKVQLKKLEVDLVAQDQRITKVRLLKSHWMRKIRR